MKKFLKGFLLILPIVLSNNCIASDFNYNVPLPGGSIANSKLQYDTIMPVYASVGTIARKCQKMRIVNTQVIITPYDLKIQNNKTVGGKWEELWTVEACSKQYDVPVKFVLDPTGATYMISPNNIQKRK